jgi:hypothetical protein
MWVCEKEYFKLTKKTDLIEPFLLKSEIQPTTYPEDIEGGKYIDLYFL